LAISVLDLRERLIFKLAVFAGLRPGEIFALRRNRLEDRSADIQERIYRGHLDTPKTRKSKRIVTLSDSVWQDAQDWMAISPVVPEQRLFPSENVGNPLWKDNALDRYIRPKLKSVKLDWVDLHVMCRTYSTLLHERGVDPKIVADLMGHDVDVNQNTYTQTSLESRFGAVRTVESALSN
jgi:integrase